jgi:hypothetical protein
MDSFRSRGTDFSTRRETTWVALEGYRYFAPGRVAMDEQRERVMTEAAQWRLIAAPESADERQSLRQTWHQFLGDLLIVIAARIRQMPACEAAVAALRESSERSTRGPVDAGRPYARRRQITRIVS